MQKNYKNTKKIIKRTLEKTLCRIVSLFFPSFRWNFPEKEKFLEWEKVEFVRTDST